MMHAANPNAANSVNRGEIVPLTVTPGSLYAENQAEAAYHLANGHQEKNGPQKKKTKVEQSQFYQAHGRRNEVITSDLQSKMWTTR